MLAITAGEPAGIGPDLVLDLINTDLAAEAVIVACPALLQQRAALLGKTVVCKTWQGETEAPGADALWVYPIATAVPVRAGQLDSANAHYVLATLDAAIGGCKSGLFAAMVTAPVHKGIINDAGISFSGHTEYLAQKTNCERVVMMLASPQLRVALVTTHLPLAAVASAITATAVRETISIVHRDLVQKFGIKNPNISVCGLNPHAGESGHMGREEIDIIAPVIRQLRAEGMQLSEPLPADTAFTPHALQGVDAVIAMYHDQGLPVLKAQGFGEAVNITLGLTIVRTSVDHGTALDLAGTGKADSGSLLTAIAYAQKLSLVSYSHVT